jgi:hypothetical protein
MIESDVIRTTGGRRLENLLRRGRRRLARGGLAGYFPGMWSKRPKSQSADRTCQSGAI